MPPLLGTTLTLSTNDSVAGGKNYVHGQKDAVVQGPGYSLGNEGGWSVTGGDFQSLQVSRRGITQLRAGYIQKHGVGDVAGSYHYVWHDGGLSAQSDEGATAISAQCLEYDDYFHGVVTATKGRGDRSPQLAFTTGQPHTSDGAFLLNLSLGTLAGNLNGPSTPLTLTTQAGTAPTFLNALPVTNVVLPVSTALGVVQAAIPNQNTTADQPKLVQVTVRLAAINGVYKAFAGGCVVVAGANYPEQSMVIAATRPTADGFQTLTLLLKEPNEQAIIFQGGLAGQYLSFDSNSTMSSYYAFGSLTGLDLIYGVKVCGGLATRVRPALGCEIAQTTGPLSGFHLYPGAEVVRNFSQGFDCQLEINGVDWKAGHVVVNPHYPVGGGATAFFLRRQHTPCDPGTGLLGLSVVLDGAGTAGGNTWGAQVFNAYSASHPEAYVDGGGTLQPPIGLGILGAWSHTLYIDRAPMPGGYLMMVQGNNRAASDITGVVNLDWNQGGNLYFTNSLGRWTFTGAVDAQNGFSSNHVPGWSGTYPTADGRTVTVSGGIIIKCE